MNVPVALVENDVLVESREADAAVPWWSFAKTVLAAAALSLVNDGRLALDEPLPGRRYTLRQLLQHRAGLGDYAGLAAYHDAVARCDPPWPRLVLLELAGADRMRYEPGRGWEYSNIGYLFVRELIEEATGEDLEGSLARLVLGPLRIKARVAATPDDLEGAVIGIEAGYHPGWVYHGLLIGPLREAALLLHRLMAGALLPRSLLAEMGDAQLLGGAIPGRPWRAPGYGLGLMSGTTTFGSRAAGHTGSGPGSVVAVYHFPGAVGGRTVATFAPGDDQAVVETAAFERAGASPVRAIS